MKCHPTSHHVMMASDEAKYLLLHINIAYINSIMSVIFSKHTYMHSHSCEHYACDMCRRQCSALNAQETR